MAEKLTSSLRAPGTTTVEECQAMIQKSLRTPMVRFLRQHLEKAGCAVEDNFFKAVTCNQQRAGAFVRGEGVIVCSNYMRIQDEVNQVVIHELIHAFDFCRAANLDWTNCAHHACSEIRAGHLSGDCHYKRELLRGFMKLRGHEQVFTPSNHRCCCCAIEVSIITYLFRNVSEEELCNHCLQMPIALVQLPRILWKLYGMFVIMIHSPLTKLLENCMVVGTSI